MVFNPKKPVSIGDFSGSALGAVCGARDRVVTVIIVMVMRMSLVVLSGELTVISLCIVVEIQLHVKRRFFFTFLGFCKYNFKSFFGFLFLLCYV